MSYGYIVKASNDVPLELIQKFNIPTAPVIFRSNESHQEVAKDFVSSIVDVALKIEKLFKTLIDINMTADDTRRYNSTKNCKFCKRSFDTVEKVRGHCYLTGRFRQSLCFKCNLDLKKHTFLPCFFHNFDSHFITYIRTRLRFTCDRDYTSQR